jgi:hypothetical protein
MTGGIIEKNKAVNGGGVYVDIDTNSTNTGNFIMNGTAEIKENETTTTSGNGGGVYNKGTFSMGSVTGSTPSIAGNISSGLGGGLYNEGIFTMGIPNVITTPDFDPVITANRASQGGGVYSRATLSPKKSYFHTGTVSGNQATGTDNTGAFLGSQLFSASGNINNLNLNTGTDNRVNTAIISGVIQP